MERYPTRILLATDGSTDAALAAQAAVDLAARSGAELHLVHAWVIVPVGTYGFPAVVPLDYPGMYEESARALLDEQARAIAAAGGTVTRTHLRMGRPADQIVDTSREIEADLVVLGSRGLGPIRRLVLGSVAGGVMHHATCPVLVVRGGETAWPPAGVVVGDDGSPEAARAADLAARLGQLVGARATLALALPEAPEVVRIEGPDTEEVIHPAREALEEHATAIQERTGLRPAVVVQENDPAELLLTMAEEQSGSTLIAVGSRGLGVIERLRLGSVSTKVLHAAHGPVLIVPDTE